MAEKSQAISAVQILIAGFLTVLLVVPVTFSRAFAADEKKPPAPVAHPAAPHVAARPALAAPGAHPAAARPFAPGARPSDPGHAGYRPGAPIHDGRGYDRRDVREHYAFHEHDVRRFNEHDRSVWQEGGWHHEYHNGRYGYWWLAGGAWYFYDAPVYPYPTVVSETVFTDPVIAAGGVTVLSASYGANINPGFFGNATGDVKALCDGRAVCQYQVLTSRLGDPAYGYRKDYSVQWSCGGPETFSARANPEAGWGAVVNLSCANYAPQPVAADVPYAPEAPPAQVVAAPQQQFWYWCDNPQGYSPYVSSCTVPWRQIPMSGNGNAPR